MRGLATLLTLAVLCGVVRPEAHTAKHFETLHSSTAGIHFAFPDEEARNRSLHDGSFVPANVVPWGLDVDPLSGKIFVSFPKLRSGIPASLTTISATKHASGANLVEPYPDWSWHTTGCDGITSVEKFAIDECGRLWVMDKGSIYTEESDHRLKQVCPPQLLAFDLKTNDLIIKYKFPASFVNDDSFFSTVVVDVISTENECKNTFVYVADSGAYSLTVYDHAHNDSWSVRANEMFPYPEYGRTEIKGKSFDFMYGVYSMALSPKDSEHGRTLYFNSWASGKETHVKTSFLQDKEHNQQGGHVHTEFITYPHPRLGGQTGSEVMDEHGVMFFNSQHDMAVFCWNHHADYTQEHFAEVDRDDEAFQLFADMKIVKRDGVAHLYILTNSYQKFFFGDPAPDDVVFRVLKAPVQTLIEGTVCAGAGAHRK